MNIKVIQVLEFIKTRQVFSIITSISYLLITSKIGPLES